MSDEFTKQDLEHFRHALRKILGHADEAVGHVEGEYLNRGSGGLDTQGDSGSDQEFEEVDLDVLDVEDAAAAAAVEALKRIGDGTFGKCTDCGAAIPRGRLEAVPYAPLCVSCQEKAEEEGA